MPHFSLSMRLLTCYLQDDLTNINIGAGGCVNSTIVQKVTFSTQGLPFGLSKKSGAAKVGPFSTWILGFGMGAAVFLGLHI